MLDQFLNELEHYIGLVPDVVWAAVIASLLTLAGVLVTNRNSRLQLVARLHHDSEQRDRERAMRLKREIYVPATEAVFRLSRIINRLTDLTMTDKEISKESGDALAAIGKVQLIASNATVQAISAYMHMWGTTYMELVLQRTPLIVRKNSIDFLGTLIIKMNNEQERWIEHMKQLNLTGNNNAQVWDVVNQNFKNSQDACSKKISEQKELMKIQQGELSEFAKLCFDKSMLLDGVIPPLLFSARDELELYIDKNEYMRQHEEYWKKGKKVFLEFMDQAEKQFHD